MFAVASCGGTTLEEACATILIPPVDVRIGDAVTGALIARGARVILQEQGTSHADTVGIPDNPGNDSVIVAIGQGPGTYDLRVEKPGYETASITGIVAHPAPGKSGTECDQPTPVILLVPLHRTA
jgi:hypothetical protein